MGLIEAEPGIQLSFQTDIVSLEPTLLIKPIFKASLPAKIAHQVLDIARGVVASIKSQLG
jgi:hypothetical protein